MLLTFQILNKIKFLDTAGNTRTTIKLNKSQDLEEDGEYNIVCVSLFITFSPKNRLTRPASLWVQAPTAFPAPSDRLTACRWWRRPTGSCRCPPGQSRCLCRAVSVFQPAATTRHGRKAQSVEKVDRWVYWWRLWWWFRNYKHGKFLSFPLALTFKVNKFHYLSLVVRSLRVVRFKVKLDWWNYFCKIILNLTTEV